MGSNITDDDFVWDFNLVSELSAKIEELNAKLLEIEEATKTINRRQEALNMKATDFPELYDLR